VGRKSKRTILLPDMPGAQVNLAEKLFPISGDNAPGTDVKGPHGMDGPEPRLWTGAPERQIGGLATTRQLGCRERRADPPKVVPLAQQPSFVRVARNSPLAPKFLFARHSWSWPLAV